LGTALLAFSAPAARADLQAMRDDGWHSWKVAAIESASPICCFAWRRGVMSRCGCNLDGHSSGFGSADEVPDTSGELQIYVRTEAGRVREIRALSADCPVTAEAEIAALDPVSSSESIGWLSTHVRADGRLADDAIMAISLHADGGIDSLIEFVEDSSIDKDLRETALFWLANSDADEAFAYLDELLMR
jgi:hypothetical protein